MTKTRQVIMTGGNELQDESGESYEVTELITLDTNVNLCLISSDEMSTEDMLRKFSDEPHVIFDVGYLK